MKNKSIIPASPPYANREIDEKFSNLDVLIREKHTDVMVAVGEVRVQTTLTNGRVRWLEKMIWLAVGGLSVVTILVLPILFSLIQAGKLL